MSDDVQDPFEIVSTPWGDMAAWKANAMAMGALSALMNQVKADSAGHEELMAPAVLSGVRSVLDALDGIDRRLAKLEKSRKERRRMDAEADEAEQFRLPADAATGSLPAPSLGPSPDPDTPLIPAASPDEQALPATLPGGDLLPG